MNKGSEKNVTIVGTDIKKVKELNANSGLSYNEAKNLLAIQMVSRHSNPMNPKNL